MLLPKTTLEEALKLRELRLKAFTQALSLIEVMEENNFLFLEKRLANYFSFPNSIISITDYNPSKERRLYFRYEVNGRNETEYLDSQEWGKGGFIFSRERTKSKLSSGIEALKESISELKKEISSYDSSLPDLKDDLALLFSITRRLKDSPYLNPDCCHTIRTLFSMAEKHIREEQEELSERIDSMFFKPKA